LGLIGNMAVGIVGALPRLGIRLGAGIITAIVNATIGAAILLFLMRFAQGQGWDKRWRW
jgi:uncharacterized membrane protein YeaQ/YmgE (transglycosylase-associated protein family)